MCRVRVMGRDACASLPCPVLRVKIVCRCACGVDFKESHGTYVDDVLLEAEA